MAGIYDSRLSTIAWIGYRDAWAGHDDAGAGVIELVERGDVPDVPEVERVL
jgi:hypothetical protein